MSRLLIISNRLPFAVERNADGVSVRQSSGGLVSAIKSFFERSSGDQHYSKKIWIGSMDAAEEDWLEARSAGELPADFEIEPLFPDPEVYTSFYSGFSNSTVWPLFHYFPSLVEYKKSAFEDYRKINQLFADKIAAICRPGDVIWVHDYQLMMVPDMLRKVMPEATIGFFLHIPFPSYEIFRLLPTEWKKQLIQGMMGADLIGFHTHDYVQHFIQSAKMTLQVESQFNTMFYGNRMVKADQFPIGIDYEKFRDACTDETVVGICTALEEKFIGQKLIFSVDRLDYTKGLGYRLNGFECFLNSHPEWIEKVVFILNVIPSRDNIPTYNDRKRSIEEKVSRINGRFSTLHWQPLIYRYNHLSFEELCGLYQAADVALLTPLRDGMNLVAKEYIASCIDKGVLVLSELTGAASELNEAVLVNPTDTDEVGEAINQALNMSLIEQRSRLSYMQRRLAEYNVQKWVNDFLDQLIMTKKDQEALKVNILKEHHIEEIVGRFSHAEKRCILLDYDGTLAPYQKLPSLAAPSSELIQLLRGLANDPSNEVVIISGRDADTLEKWLGSLPLNMIAEHGACVKYKDDEWKEQFVINTEWKEQVRPLMQLFVDRCAGSFIEEKKSTLAWHYRNTNQELGFMRSRELRNNLLQFTTNTSLQVIDGNRVLEVRMVGVDKGAAANKMLANINPDFVLCIGDDATDEDMFRALREKGYTIKIGRANTAAQYTILSQREVFPFLNRFIQPIQRQEPSYS
ncbi:MAG TPA: bifunctional alpha,alpha-trehalose-phosphate synthase (UDP-forming)/trehalose-phosphatase [Flavisolibacter sp.]|nr:bifunctional alpha,alpha-trehalose-phosphate synthase (UDP-forming)/trehalose-phosphatase [Flavisolibacter sp.]